jgi:hypothetical protein
MKILIKNSLLFLILIPFYALAQEAYLLKEKELVVLLDSIRKVKGEEEKFLLSDAIALELELMLAEENSMQYPFDSLKLISKIVAPDKSWRMFNWHIEDDKKQHKYWAIIQYKHQNKYRVVSLMDAAEDLKSPESKTIKAPQWYGAHYYNVFMPEKNKYYLLGYNGRSNIISQKIIEVMSFDNKGNIIFGDDVFITEKGNPKRMVFEYSREVSMSLKYYEKNKIIVFDHLAPREPHLVNSKQFYGPDLSYDAFEYKKGKWELLQNIDVRKYAVDNKKLKYNNPE